MYAHYTAHIHTEASHHTTQSFPGITHHTGAVVNICTTIIMEVLTLINHLQTNKQEKKEI